jgi:hypothetical protein
MSRAPQHAHAARRRYRGHKIIVILARSFGLIAFSIYRSGAADAQHVGPRATYRMI